MHLQSIEKKVWTTVNCKNLLIPFSIKKNLFHTQTEIEIEDEDEEWKISSYRNKTCLMYFFSFNWFQLLLKWEHSSFYFETFVFCECEYEFRLSTILHILSYFKPNQIQRIIFSRAKNLHNCLLISFDCLFCWVCACVCL